MEFILLFILGLLVGSFLNVVIFRMEREESFVGGRSHCLNCGHNLAWYDNIPLVSFTLLRGKCRYCGTPFSWQYPAVELATGVAFALTYFSREGATEWFHVGILFFLLLSICFGILIAVYDLRFSLIPHTFLWGINLSTACYLLLHWVFVPDYQTFLLPTPSAALAGAFFTGAFFFILVSFSRETWMGWGDVWLGVWGGMLVGLPLVQVFITLSFTLGAIVGLTLIYKKQKTLKAEIPFAPYLLLAGFLVLSSMYTAPAILRFLSPWLPGTIE